MPRLIVLNGPPGCGKSTIAARYVDDHPLALNLDIDAVRRLLGRWKDTPQQAGLAARELAVAAGRVHLQAGHDVVVPQYLGRADFLARLQELAGETGADYHEIVLFATKDVAVARFRARTAGATSDAMHLDAQDMLERAGGPAQLEAMYDRLLLVLAARPIARLVNAPEGDVATTYGDVLAALE